MTRTQMTSKGESDIEMSMKRVHKKSEDKVRRKKAQKQK